MWVWVLCAIAVIASSITFIVVALRSWRQIIGLRTMIVGVRHELESYAARLQVTVPADRHN